MQEFETLIKIIQNNTFVHSSKEKVLVALKESINFLQEKHDAYEKQVIIKIWKQRAEDAIRYSAFSDLNRTYNIFGPDIAFMLYISLPIFNANGVTEFKTIARKFIDEIENELIEPVSSLLDSTLASETLDKIKEMSPILKEMDLKNQTQIFVFPFSNQKYDAYTSYNQVEENEKTYRIYLFSPVQQKRTPLYSLLYQIGNIISREFCSDKEDMVIPDSFYRIARPFLDIERITDKEQMSVLFNDCFATAALHYVNMDSFNPFPFKDDMKDAMMNYFLKLNRHTSCKRFDEQHSYYNVLKEAREKKKAYSIYDIPLNILKRLIILEYNSPNSISSVVKEDSKEVQNYVRNKLGRTLKDYKPDQTLMASILMSYRASDKDHSVEVLQGIKESGVKEIYHRNERDPWSYEVSFRVEEELERQKQIAEYNKKNPKKKHITLLQKYALRLYEHLVRGELNAFVLANEWSIGDSNFWKKQIEYFMNEISPLLKQTFSEEEINDSPKNDITLPTLVEFKMTGNHQKGKNKRKTKKKKTDYVELQKAKQEVGMSGQEIVLHFEKEKLKDNPKLQKKIIPYYEIDDSVGYDIESYQTDGTKIYIEVKTSSTNKNNHNVSFYISSNEDEFILANENSFIYYVYDLENPKLKIIPREDYITMTKESRVFHINVDC